MSTKILLAEDERMLSQAVQTKLLKEEYEVIAVETGEEALQHAEEVNLILLDIIMPKMDGLEVLAELEKKGITKKVNVVMLTNLDRQSDRDSANEHGAAGYVVKSETDLDSFPEIVKKYLEMPAGDHSKSSASEAA